MFSDDLEDKIAAIMRGNFSPAKGAVPVPKLAKPLTNSSSNNSISSLEEQNPDAKVVSSDRQRNETTDGGQSPKRSLGVAYDTGKKRYDSKTDLLSSSNSSIPSIVEDTVGPPVPSNDIAAMILKLQNSSREPSPTVNSEAETGRHSPKTSIGSDGARSSGISNAAGAASPIAASTSSPRPQGIAAVSPPPVTGSAETQVATDAERETPGANDSAMDDMLFGELNDGGVDQPLPAAAARSSVDGEAGHADADIRRTGSDDSGSSGSSDTDQQSQSVISDISSVASTAAGQGAFRNYDPSLAARYAEPHGEQPQGPSQPESTTQQRHFLAMGDNSFDSGETGPTQQDRDPDSDWDEDREAETGAAAGAPLPLQRVADKEEEAAVDLGATLSNNRDDSWAAHQKQQSALRPVTEVVSVPPSPARSVKPAMQPIAVSAAPSALSATGTPGSSVQPHTTRPPLPSPKAKGIATKTPNTATVSAANASADTASKASPAADRDHRAQAVVQQREKRVGAESTGSPTPTADTIGPSLGQSGKQQRQQRQELAAVAATVPVAKPTAAQVASPARPVEPTVRLEEVYQYGENTEDDRGGVVDADRHARRQQQQETVNRLASRPNRTNAASPSLRRPSDSSSVASPGPSTAAHISVPQTEPKPRTRAASPVVRGSNPSISSQSNPMRSGSVTRPQTKDGASVASSVDSRTSVSKAARPVSAARARGPGWGSSAPPTAEAEGGQSPSTILTPSTGPSESPARTHPHVVERPVKVAVRVRPFTTAELDEGARRTIARSNDRLIIVNPKAFDAEPDTIAAAAVAMDNKQWAQAFQFNHFLWASDPCATEPPTELRAYANQQDVYDSVGCEIVDSVLAGVSASCFAYGHTGTGKTHSLFGNIVGNNSHGSRSSHSRSSTPMKHASSSSSSSGGVGVSALAAQSTITPDSGLIPRVMHQIVAAVNSRDMFGSDTRMFFSFVEIYNEKIVDLLTANPTAEDGSVPSLEASALKAREHPVFGTYVEGLNKVEVSSPEEVLRLIARGQSRRSTMCTAWNSVSSRSHAVVTLELSPTNFSANMKFISPSAKNNDKFLSLAAKKEALAQLSSPNTSVSSAPSSSHPPHQHLFTRVQMVDLAGSEKDAHWGSGINSSTHDENGIWKGTRYNDTTPNKLAEARGTKEKNELKLIRRSLSTLGYIIKALAKGAAFKSLPYRDSVLTFLLRDALNGHNHTTMLATISPADSCYEETLSTLRYAEKLCNLRAQHNLVHHSHMGRNGSSVNHSISYGSPVTSLVANDRELQLSRAALLEEFGRIHDDLGHNKPGSNASRQLHYQTISDPQQRIAKMTKMIHSSSEQKRSDGAEGDASETHEGIPERSATPSDKGRRGSAAISDGLTKDAVALASSELDALKNSHRALQGQLVELQIDLEGARADRDSMAGDLRATREQLAALEATKSDSKSTVASLGRSLKAAEKEIAEYRSLLHKKEDAIERVLGEISAEKQGRLDAEHAYHSRTKDFLTRFEAMKKENKSLSSNLEAASHKYRAFADEKRDLQAQIDKLRAAAKSLSLTRDSLGETAEALTAENAALKAEVADLKQQLLAGSAGNSADLANYELANTELTLMVNRLQGSLLAMTAERDDLSALLAQKDTLLQAQSQQAEASVKTLQQRQAAVEKREAAAAASVAAAKAQAAEAIAQYKEQQQHQQMLTQTESQAAIMGSSSSEDYTQLHESLRALFTSEGQVLHSERQDTERLVAKVRALREKMLQFDSLEAALGREKAVSQALHAKFKEYRAQAEAQLDGVRADAATQQDRLRAQVEEARAHVKALTEQLQQHQQLLQKQQQQQQSDVPHRTVSAHPSGGDHHTSVTHIHNNSTSTNLTSSNSSTTSLNNNSSSSMYLSTALEVQLRTENNLLREQLVLCQADCASVKEDARAAQEAQQKELSSLWSSMQELNRLDVAKDQSIHALTEDRDRALKERDGLAERVRLLTAECEELQREIGEMDADLVAAVEMTGAPPQYGHPQQALGGAAAAGSPALQLHRVPDRMVHGIMRRRQRHQLQHAPHAAEVPHAGPMGQTPPPSSAPLSQPMSVSSAFHAYNYQQQHNQQQHNQNHQQQQQQYGTQPHQQQPSTVSPQEYPNYGQHSHQQQPPVPQYFSEPNSGHSSQQEQRPYYNPQQYSDTQFPHPPQQQQQQQQQQQPRQQQPPPPPAQQYPPAPPPSWPPVAPVNWQQTLRQDHPVNPSNGRSSSQRTNQQTPFQQHQPQQQQRQGVEQHHSSQSPPLPQQPPSRPQAQPARRPQGGPSQFSSEDDRQYDLSEKILQRQIEELSDFLDDEAKLKRTRLLRSSNGSLSSLAQSSSSSAVKRPKIYTPTTKLNFEF